MCVSDQYVADAAREMIVSADEALASENGPWGEALPILRHWVFPDQAAKDLPVLDPGSDVEGVAGWRRGGSCPKESRRSRSLKFALLAARPGTHNLPRHTFFGLAGTKRRRLRARQTPTISIRADHQHRNSTTADSHLTGWSAPSRP